MSRYPVEAKPRRVRAATDTILETTGSRREARTFTAFRYASMEISVTGGTARGRSRSAQLKDGKFSAETFEGDVDRAVYDQMVANVQRHLGAETALLLGLFGAFLPSRCKR